MKRNKKILVGVLATAIVLGGAGYAAVASAGGICDGF